VHPQSELARQNYLHSVSIWSHFNLMNNREDYGYLSDKGRNNIKILLSIIVPAAIT
jgi:hypothetical protein